MSNARPRLGLKRGSASADALAYPIRVGFVTCISKGPGRERIAAGHALGVEGPPTILVHWGGAGSRPPMCCSLR